MLGNVQANLHMFPVSSHVSGSAEALSEIEKLTDELPMAFSDNNFVPAEQCPKCPGRFGYVIHPMPGMVTLYQVTLRLKHRDLYGNGLKNIAF